MSRTLSPWPRVQIIDGDGNPLAAGKIYTYATGTSTPKATYVSESGSANTNPVILDADGYADIWLLDDGEYRFRVETSAGVLVWQKDGISGGGAAITDAIAAHVAASDPHGDRAYSEDYTDKYTVMPKLGVDLVELLKANTARGRCYAIKDDNRSLFGIGMDCNGYNAAEYEFTADADGFWRMRYGYTNQIRDSTTTAQAANTRDGSGTPVSIGSIATSGDNKYYSSAQVGYKFDIDFTGTGLVFRYYSDDRGGVWKVTTDGTIVTYVSCWSESASSDNKTVVCAGLESGSHTAVFEFMGDYFTEAGLPEPTTTSTGFPRGWFKYDAALINISGITQANGGVVTTSASHGLSVGLSISIASVGGMTEINGDWYVHSVPTTTTFTLRATSSVTAVDTSEYTAYTSGGTINGTINISAITKDTEGVITTTGAHGLTSGDAITIASVGGMTEINGRWHVYSAPTSTTLKITASPLDTTDFGVYTSGGTVNAGREFTTGLVITGDEMAMDWNGKTLTLISILEFAIDATADGSGITSAWVPYHTTVGGPANGSMTVDSRSIYIDGAERAADLSDWPADEFEISDFAIVQAYTAYSKYDSTKAYPLWSGVFTHRFNADGLTFSHTYKTVDDVAIADGFGVAIAGKISSFGEIRMDNAYSRTMTTPGSGTNEYRPGYAQSALMFSTSTGDAAALSVQSIYASTSDDKSFKEAGFPTLLTERSDGIQKLYFVQSGPDDVIPSGTKLHSTATLFHVTGFPLKSVI